MKHSLPLLAAALLCLTTSLPGAIIISQTNNFSNIGVAGDLYNWNQFDSNLGTLLSVSFTLSGSASGNFRVVSTDEEGVDVFNPRGRLRAHFEAGSGPAPGDMIGALTPFLTTPGTTTGSPFAIAPFGLEDFFIIEPAPLLTVTSSNLVSFGSYFIGASTFQTHILRNFTVGLDGGTSTQSYVEALASGVMTLDYTYTPSTAIPEPGTWAAAALLAGGAAFVRWRKRKKA
jgi:hypothetical protein